MHQTKIVGLNPMYTEPITKQWVICEFMIML